MKRSIFLSIILSLFLVACIPQAMAQKQSRLEKLLEKGAAMTDVPDKAAFYEEKVLPAMSALREPADQLETLLGKDFWPMPTYTDLMYGIL